MSASWRTAGASLRLAVATRPWRPVVFSLSVRRCYNALMIRAHEEIVDFIAAGGTPESIARFEPSRETKDYAAELIHKEKTSGLTTVEASDLDHFLEVEHIMRLAKARARRHCSQIPGVSR